MLSGRKKDITINIKYYEQLYANKLDNLDEIDKFLENHSKKNRKSE